MTEQIYTIPINEAYEKVLSVQTPECPYCLLYSMLEKNAIDYVTGGAMMEPDTRIMTNKLGFCKNHLSRLVTSGKKLPVGLMMESHLAEVEKEIFSGGTLFDAMGEKEQKKLDTLESSCFVCGRINDAFDKMMHNAVWLWENDEQFRERFSSVRCYCLPHYKSLLIHGRSYLGKKQFPAFYKAARQVVSSYLSALSGDVSWFCKKFDYRYKDAPWNDSRDAVERTAAFLGSGVNDNENSIN